MAASGVWLSHHPLRHKTRGIPGAMGKNISTPGRERTELNIPDYMVFDLGKIIIEMDYRKKIN